MSSSDLIHDWSAAAPRKNARRVELLDETLRDGLQSPSVQNPSFEHKREALRRMAALRVAAVNVGLPTVSATAADEVKRLLGFIRDERLPLLPVCAGRTVLRDVEEILELGRASGVRLEVSLFVGASPIRWRAEGWDLRHVRELVRTAITAAARADFPVTFVTEDTTRSRPETLRELFATALGCGATRLCLCDTVGTATPAGVRRLVEFTRELVEGSGHRAALDWHGHDDRGLALANALAAAEAGVDRLQATALGVGERVGNTPLELLHANLALDAGEEPDAAALRAYLEHFTRALGVSIPDDYPLFGKNAFRTATGVHAAAIVKALRQDVTLADRVYTAVPASQFGGGHEIRISYMSGRSNVVYWLERRGIPPEPRFVEAILSLAKRSNRMLEDAEVEACVRALASLRD